MIGSNDGFNVDDNFLVIFNVHDIFKGNLYLFYTTRCKQDKVNVKLYEVEWNEQNYMLDIFLSDCKGGICKRW